MSSMRTVIYVLGAVAALSLAALLLPFITLGDDIRTYVTWVFWGSFVVLLVALYLAYRNDPGATEIQISGPGFARFLFNNRAAGLFWLPIRLFVGISWLDAGLHKLSDPGWMQGGQSLLEYWERVVAIPEAPARPSITYDWYRGFIQILIDNDAQTWFGPLIALGETAVGLGLLVGALTGIAAFFGATMNMSFMLAGSASTNPILFTMAVGLMLAWKVAGYYGLDRYLLPRLGTPWSSGSMFRRGSPGSGDPPPTSTGEASSA